MIEKMSLYFTGEKQESLLFITVGILSIAVAAWLFLQSHRLKSMAFPLVTIALIQLIVGGSVYFRTDNQLSTLAKQSIEAPNQFKAEESKRMEVVMKNFAIYKWIEISLIFIGVGLILLIKNSDWAVGIGAGLVLQSAFMLCLDMFAEARGQDYLEILNKF
jgi:hypothetical protein